MFLRLASLECGDAGDIARVATMVAPEVIHMASTSHVHSEPKQPNDTTERAEEMSADALIADEIQPARSTEPDDSDRVTVLYGYGKVGSNTRFWLDNTLFVGGIAQHVPYATARAWKKLPIGRAIHILPDAADEASYAKAAGIQPMAPARLAAMIEASDVDAVFEALGPERARKLMNAIQARIDPRA